MIVASLDVMVPARDTVLLATDRICVIEAPAFPSARLTSSVR